MFVFWLLVDHCREMELRNGRSAYDDDIFVQKPILPYSSMFILSSSNPWVLLNPHLREKKKTLLRILLAEHLHGKPWQECTIPWLMMAPFSSFPGFASSSTALWRFRSLTRSLWWSSLWAASLWQPRIRCKNTANGTTFSPILTTFSPEFLPLRWFWR